MYYVLLFERFQNPYQNCRRILSNLQSSLKLRVVGNIKYSCLLSNLHYDCFSYDLRVALCRILFLNTCPSKFEAVVSPSFHMNRRPTLTVYYIALSAFIVRILRFSSRFLLHSNLLHFGWNGTSLFLKIYCFTLIMQHAFLNIFVYNFLSSDMSTVGRDNDSRNRLCIGIKYIK